MGMLQMFGGQIYPTSGDSAGEEYGTQAGPARVLEATVPAAQAGGAGAAQVAESIQVGGQASPALGLLVFAAMAAGISYAARRVGGEGEGFSNIKASAFNILFISLVALAGMPVWKAFFSYVKVPGVSTYVHAA